MEGNAEINLRKEKYAKYFSAIVEQFWLTI